MSKPTRETTGLSQRIYSSRRDIKLTKHQAVLPCAENGQLLEEARSRAEKVVASARIRRSQSLLTVLVVATPTIGTMAAVGWALVRPVGCTEIVLLAVMWLISLGLGIDLGFHRLLAHRSFEAPAVVRLSLAVAGATAFQGPPIYWTALHRRHHEYSDVPGDPHSPKAPATGFLARLRGLWHGHIAWMVSYEIPNTLHYVPDLLKDPVVMWVNRHYLLIALAGLLIPSAIGGICLESWEGALAGLLWGGFVRIFLCSNLIWSINSICHVFGSRNHDTDDDSRNVAVLAIPTFGESWHNNHHAFPSSACLSSRWWQLDPGYLIIWVLERVGLARNVHVTITRTRMETRRDGVCK